jgi:hypothetical protein
MTIDNKHEPDALLDDVIVRAQMQLATGKGHTAEQLGAALPDDLVDAWCRASGAAETGPPEERRVAGRVQLGSKIIKFLGTRGLYSVRDTPNGKRIRLKLPRVASLALRPSSRPFVLPPGTWHPAPIPVQPNCPSTLWRTCSPSWKVRPSRS